MNDRIRELAQQATIQREEYFPGDDGHPTITSYFDKERFAELIAKDCMDNLYEDEEDDEEIDE